MRISIKKDSSKSREKIGGMSEDFMIFWLETRANCLPHMHNYTRILRLLIISKYYYDATGESGKKRVRNAGKTTLSQPIFTEERFEVRPQSKKKTNNSKKEDNFAKKEEKEKNAASIFTNTDEDEDDILEEWSEDANSDRSGDTKLSKVVLEDNIIGINWRDNLCWFDSVIHSLTFVEGFVDWLKAIDTNEAKMLRAMLVSIRN
ncbi:hypothetical protein M0813_08657 [Anaeramoeba flamelloides]|uniref:Uncharacterized protein n=1 Tax=Anaeramoeba flamelloides TaxID=1746091 RepID=A0ABQ8X8X7_9EUKA|nr:hypothetical protein M0813_08657 [Anaeramoeba flamelloides]